MEKEKQVCRACALETDKYRSLHKEGYIMGEITTLGKLLSFCIDIDFPADELDMPTVICEKCVPQLAKSYKFKQQVLLANECLRGTEEITEITITDNDAEEAEYLMVGVVNNNEVDGEVENDDEYHISERMSIENEKLRLEEEEEDTKTATTKTQQQMVEVDVDEEIDCEINHTKSVDAKNQPKFSIKSVNMKKEDTCHNYVLSMIDGDDNNIDVKNCEAEEEEEEFISDENSQSQSVSQDSDIQSDTAEDKIMKLLPNLKPVKRRKMKKKPLPRQDLQCEVCSKQLSNPNSYRYHMQLHSDDTPYLCSLCGERFKTRNAYDGHKAIHDPNNPNKCDLCGKIYRQASSLRAHMLTHTGEKPFVCGICGKGMTQKSGYKKHLLTHTGEKPHVCDFCGREFRYSSNLIAHRRCHTGEKPYECSTCGKCFISSEQLKRHKVVHTGERPHKCNICDRKFKRRATLLQHTLLHESEDGKNMETVDKLKDEKTTKSNLIEIY